MIRAANLAIDHFQFKLARRHASADLEWQRRAATLGGILTSMVTATVGFVAADAQFTPKSVETADEREKLMFRIKLQVDPKVLGKYHTQVKTGVRGIGFARTDAAVKWPDDLAVRLP